MMKAIKLCLALTLAAVLGAANAAPVLDTDGDPLEPNKSYYVRAPYTSATIDEARGGGLILASRGSERPCPPDIIQSNVSSNNGFPVRFSGWASGYDIVPESENLHIETLSYYPSCPLQRTYYWWLDAKDEKWGERFVTTNDSLDSSRSFFKIVKFNQGTYKFVAGDLCIGKYTKDHGIRRLAISDVPFEVVFLKAPEYESTKGSTAMI